MYEEKKYITARRVSSVVSITYNCPHCDCDYDEEVDAHISTNGLEWVDIWCPSYDTEIECTACKKIFIIEGYEDVD